MKIVKNILILLFLVCWKNTAVAVGGIPTKNEFMSVVKSESYIEQTLDLYELKGEVREVVAEHLRKLWGMDSVITALFQEINKRESVNLSSKDTLIYYRELGARLIANNQKIGFKVLSVSDLRAFLKFTKRWLEVASPTDCKGVFSSSNTSAMSAQFVESRYFHKFDKQELTNYFFLLRKAVMAGLEADGRVPSLGASEKRYANDIFVNEMKKRERNGDIPIKTLNAFADYEKADAVDACNAAILYVRVLYETPEPEGIILIRNYFD